MSLSHHVPKVIVVVLNWRQAEETVACLDSLKQQTHPKVELLVVDNHSGDGSMTRIRAAHPNVALLENDRNAGFAGGMNLGIRWALEHNADWVFVVNNDTAFSPDVIEQLLAHVKSGVALLAPIIYYAAAPRTVWSRGGTFNRLLEVDDVGRGVKDEGRLPKTIPVEFVPGCAMLLSRYALETVGLFDERFFMYYEDSDLCFRIRQAGLRVVTVTAAQMWHKVAISSGGADSPSERYWMARSSVRFFAKHGRFPKLLLIIAWRLASALRTTLRLRRQGNSAALRAYWRGLRHGFKDLRA